MFVVKNKDFFKTNSDIHSFNTRFNHDLHIPIANLAAFQNGVWYSGIKVYNHLPLPLKHLSHDGFTFKAALKRFLLANSIYTLEEYYSWKQGFWFLVLVLKNITVIVLLFKYVYLKTLMSVLRFQL